MNVLFDNRSSIRPFFPIHPSIYPQNLLKKFVSIGNGIRIISLDFFVRMYESEELVSTERRVEHHKRNQTPMFARNHTTLVFRTLGLVFVFNTILAVEISSAHPIVPSQIYMKNPL